MWLSIFWFIPSEESPFEKERREIHERNTIDRDRYVSEEMRRVMIAEYRKGIEGYKDYLKNK